tara:strand:+ start:633 stop:1415 length:783 start_codon:yes stop_codon:yes gene_type:complete
MNDEKEFKKKIDRQLKDQKKNRSINNLSKKWMKESIKSNYSYHFEWLGRPIIQYPQDIIAVQQILWETKPDLIIETGIARGGSLIFYASILDLISKCGGPSNFKIIGIDVDIRKHNKKRILSHAMSKNIEMIEGSSIDLKIFHKVKKKCKNAKKILILLDSNHTQNHVFEELKLYGSIVSKNSYMIVFDTIIENLPNKFYRNRPWSKGNNPKTAVVKYLKEIKNKNYFDQRGRKLKFIKDDMIENKILLTTSPGGFLKRV